MGYWKSEVLYNELWWKNHQLLNMNLNVTAFRVNITHTRKSILYNFLEQFVSLLKVPAFQLNVSISMKSRR